MQKQLDKQEQQEFNKIRQNRLNAAQEETVNLCLQYYLDYKAKAGHILSDKIGLAFRCAFFMSQKSKIQTNIKGEKQRGVSFSLNNLLKDFKLDQCTLMLKDMIKLITCIDPQTNNYLSTIVKQISFMINFHSKFQKTLTQKLELRDKNNDGGQYVRTFTNFGWVLYIIAKSQLLKKSLDLVPNTCMIAHIISFLLILGWQYIKPQGLMKGDKRLNENSSQRDVKKIIKQKMLQTFCIKQVHQYGRIANSFEMFFEKMIENNLFRMSQQKFDFLSPENILFNYKKLDKYYQNKLSMQLIDERVFLKQRAMNFTPSKFTPFARQGYANKYQKPTLGNKLGGSKLSKQQTFNSHRVINYEAVEKQIQTKNVPLQQIKLPKNVMQSPLMVKAPMIVATPISMGMEMFNYINEKKKRIKQIYVQQRHFDKYIFPLMNQVFDNHRNQNDKINKQTKLQMIMALYKIFTEEYLAANSFQKQTPQLMKAFLGLSLQLVFFVSNVTLTFQTIQQQLAIDPYQMWKAIDFYLKSDKLIPTPIKLHFLDLQVNFISYKIWQNQEMVNKIYVHCNKSQKQMTENDLNTTEKLFKRVFHQTAFQTSKLTTLLNIQESVSQKIFDLLKQILANCTDLLFRRHIDQLILCSIFAYSRALSLNIKFNDIKQSYIQSNQHLKGLCEQILTNIYISQNQQPKDIINFYNKVFIQMVKIKQFIISTLDSKNSANTAKNNAKKNTLLMSPMKAIIPKQINFKSKNGLGGNNQPKSKNGMTPLLYAYTQSPILKYQTNNFNNLKGQFKSKKVINFEYEQQKFKNGGTQQDENPIMKPTNSDNNIHQIHIATNQNNNQLSTNQYISKKYGRKATTPTNQHQSNTTQGIHNYSTVQQLHIPLQNITKQNQMQPASSNSHRALFDIALEKKQGNYMTQIEDNKYKNKNYQFGTIRRQ